MNERKGRGKKAVAPLHEVGHAQGHGVIPETVMYAPGSTQPCLITDGHFVNQQIIAAYIMHLRGRASALESFIHHWRRMG